MSGNKRIVYEKNTKGKKRMLDSSLVTRVGEKCLIFWYRSRGVADPGRPPQNGLRACIDRDLVGVQAEFQSVEHIRFRLALGLRGQLERA